MRNKMDGDSQWTGYHKDRTHLDDTTVLLNYEATPPNFLSCELIKPYFTAALRGYFLWATEST